MHTIITDSMSTTYIDLNKMPTRDAYTSGLASVRLPDDATGTRGALVHALVSVAPSAAMGDGGSYHAFVTVTNGGNGDECRAELHLMDTSDCGESVAAHFSYAITRTYDDGLAALPAVYNAIVMATGKALAEQNRKRIANHIASIQNEPLRQDIYGILGINPDGTRKRSRRGISSVYVGCLWLKAHRIHSGKGK